MGFAPLSEGVAMSTGFSTFPNGKKASSVRRVERRFLMFRGSLSEGACGSADHQPRPVGIVLVNRCFAHKGSLI